MLQWKYFKLLIVASIFGIHMFGNAAPDKKDITNKLSKHISVGGYKHIGKTIQQMELTLIPDEQCELCNKVADFILTYRRTGASKNSMKALFQFICEQLQHNEVRSCSEGININIDTYLFIIDNKKNLTSQSICKLYLPAKNCYDPNANNWTINIPPEPKKNIFSKNKNHTQYLHLLHLSDIHYDPDYMPGSSAVCIQPLCCERDSTPKENQSHIVAGHWGDYNVCDMPKHSVENLFQQVKTHKTIDFVYFTGDIISHRSWTTTAQGNMDIIQYINDLMKSSFGTKIKVYPVLGNHEAHPVDYWTPQFLSNSSLSSQWLFNFVASQWSAWLPSDALETVRKGGYYTVVVQPGLRVVVINSNVCFTSNIYFLLTPGESLCDKRTKDSTPSIEIRCGKGQMSEILGTIITIEQQTELLQK